VILKKSRANFLGALLSIVMISTVATSSSASTSGSDVLWGPAMMVRELPTHNLLFGSDLFSVSCASVGNCSAGGNYALNAKKSQAFVVNETHGVWGKAEPVPGFTRSDASENTEVYVVSCSSAGNCSAGGSYAVDKQNTHVFVMSERNGTWGRAIEVPGSAGISRSGGGFITTISCASAGNCSAGGILPVAFSSTISGAFVVNESNGVWGKAIELRGPQSFNHNGAGVDSLSCSSVGNCSAGGAFPKGRNGTPSFVVDETNGKWGKVQEIPGFAKLNLGGESELRSLSCGSAGSCSAVGQYQQKSGVPRAYIASESKGVWGPAFDVPGLVKLNGQHMSQLTTISCPAVGTCSAGGYYGKGDRQTAFIESERKGVWGMPMTIPGLTTLNKGHTSYMQAISCISVGNCGASGTYSDADGNAQSFLINETGGTWGQATAMHGLQKLKADSAGILSISCGAPRSCSAVGGFSASNNNGAVIESTEPQR
jgi:hypothetical protein